MPLTRAAQRYISNKISILVREGYPQKQAIAIAYSMARDRGYKVPGRTPTGSPDFVKRAIKKGESMATKKRRSTKKKRTTKKRTTKKRATKKRTTKKRTTKKRTTKKKATKKRRGRPVKASTVKKLREDNKKLRKKLKFCTRESKAIAKGVSETKKRLGRIEKALKTPTEKSRLGMIKRSRKRR